MSLNAGRGMDHETELHLSQMAAQEDVLSNRVSGVKFILVVLSARGMVYDIESLRQKILLSYSDSAVFFITTLGKSIGPAAPRQVDLLVDFTGPGQRQGWFFAKKLRRQTRFAVGRNAGWYRMKIYDRVFDEEAQEKSIPQEILNRERFVQKKVLNLAGVAFVQAGDTPVDQGKTIALNLPGILSLK